MVGGRERALQNIPLWVVAVSIEGGGGVSGIVGLTLALGVYSFCGSRSCCLRELWC